MIENNVYRLRETSYLNEMLVDPLSERLLLHCITVVYNTTLHTCTVIAVRVHVIYVQQRCFVPVTDQSLRQYSPHSTQTSVIDNLQQVVTWVHGSKTAARH